MKEFNLEEAKAGKPVCTRDGKKARIICFDYRDEEPIIALVEVYGEETIFTYNCEGRYDSPSENKLDLMMAGEKKEGWVNLYRVENIVMTGLVYDTKKQATSKVDPKDFITTAKIEWEE